MIFSIGNPVQFTFNLELDENGRLTELTASNGESVYDCQIQLTSRSDPDDVACCTTTCSAGPCSA